jgi:hypothetical protein
MSVNATTTSFSVLSRAMSPVIGGVTSDAGAVDSSEAQTRRHMAILGSNSIEELIEMIPSDYRDCLREPLIKVAATATKRYQARETLSKWRTQKGAGKYPSCITTKTPEVQLTKDYRGTTQAADDQSALEKLWKKYLDDSFDSIIKSKQNDMDHLEALLRPSSLRDALLVPTKARWAELLPLRQDVVITTDIAGAESIEWIPSKAALRIAQTVQDDALTYALRVISIVEARESSARRKLEKKKGLAASADVEMADATRPGPSTQSMIDKAVNARLKSLGITNKGGKKVRSPWNHIPNILSDFASAEYAAEQQEVRREERRQKGASNRTLQAPSYASWEEGPSSPQLRQERQGQGEVVGGIRRQGERETFQEVEQLASPDFRYDAPTSYPDWLLTIPYPRAISYIILNTPVDIVLASQYRNFVHLSPGVNVPLNIQHQLSVGLRYMFPTPRNEALIWDAWRDFQRRLRWRLFFEFRNEDDDSYDPEYEVPHDSTGKPPILPHYLELGLKRGELFVKSTIAKIRSTPAEPAKFKSLTPSVVEIREFLTSNNYVVTATDKNLGSAVSERTWLIEQCKKLLSDTDNYRPIHLMVANSYFEKQCTEMEEISSLSRELPNGKQLGPFFRSNVTPRESSVRFTREHTVPEFYGIPKIHKVPTKMRPIIPCHSAIQNPAAKYVSKKLKGLIRATPTIIHGTKDLAIKLSQLRLTPGRRWFIVTGDVVAMYPNIPIERCLNIVAEMYERFEYGDQGAQTTEELREMEIFLRCLLVGNKDLICKYDGQYYRQLQGLAMGVADSPDLANLYSAYDEQQARLLEDPIIAFYGRYIDDCIAIVYASSEENALSYVSSHVRFESLQITWDCSEWHAHFLDMTLYKDRDLSIQWMPYRKGQNHMERIPWISSHPYDVKRGTFLGEMSRLATLSSKFSTYSEALKSLVALYVTRGYPSMDVEKWLRDNIASKWQKRLNDTRTANAADGTGEVLVLKSEFNTAWNYFSARELGEVILGTWRDYAIKATSGDLGTIDFPLFPGDLGGLDGEADDALCADFDTSDGPRRIPDIRELNFLQRKVIVSRKRTRNLFDLTSLWKKTVLHKLDVDALDTDVEMANPQESDLPDFPMDVDSSTSDDNSSGESDGIDPNFYIQQALGNWNH